MDVSHTMKQCSEVKKITFYVVRAGRWHIYIYIIQFLHADNISLTPPRARHLTLRKLLWRKVVTLLSACSGQNYNFRCINFVFWRVFCARQRARWLKAELTFNNDSRTPKKLRVPDGPKVAPVVYSSKCQKSSVNRSVKGTSKASYPVRAAQYLTSTMIPWLTIIPRVTQLRALLPQKRRPNANRNE